jgi:hypothetical protein
MSNESLGLSYVWLDIWLEMERMFPGSTVQWDIQGGPEWIAGRSGPRIYILGSLYIYVGGSATVDGDSPWESTTWYHLENKWFLDKKNRILLNGLKSRL